jgi:hypothetical protein
VASHFQLLQAFQELRSTLRAVLHLRESGVEVPPDLIELDTPVGASLEILQERVHAAAASSCFGVKV